MDETWWKSSVFKPGVRQQWLAELAQAADTEMRWEKVEVDDDTRALTLVMKGNDGVEASVTWVRSRNDPRLHYAGKPRTAWTPWRQADSKWPVRFTRDGQDFKATMEWATDWLRDLRHKAVTG